MTIIIVILICIAFIFVEIERQKVNDVKLGELTEASGNLQVLNTEINIKNEQLNSELELKKQQIIELENELELRNKETNELNNELELKNEEIGELNSILEENSKLIHDNYEESINSKYSINTNNFFGYIKEIEEDNITIEVVELIAYSDVERLEELKIDTSVNPMAGFYMYRFEDEVNFQMSEFFEVYIYDYESNLELMNISLEIPEDQLLAESRLIEFGMIGEKLFWGIEKFID